MGMRGIVVMALLCLCPIAADARLAISGNDGKQLQPGEDGKVAQMTLVWGTALVAGGAVATAELAQLAVDQALLTEDRFTLIAPDDYRGDLLEIRLWGRSGSELAHESLYEED